MHERTEIELRRALKFWQARQHHDGCLAAILVFLSLVATLRFLFYPGSGSAFVMGLFLAALVASCLRLLNSVAKVVEIRKTLYPSVTVAPEIIDVEVLAPVESHAKAPGSARCRNLLN